MYLLPHIVGDVKELKYEEDVEKTKEQGLNEEQVEPEPETTLYIKNLSFTTSEQRVKEVSYSNFEMSITCILEGSGS